MTSSLARSRLRRAPKPLLHRKRTDRSLVGLEWKRGERARHSREVLRQKDDGLQLEWTNGFVVYGADFQGFGEALSRVDFCENPHESGAVASSRPVGMSGPTRSAGRLPGASSRRLEFDTNPSIFPGGDG
jgi:hypothetical protein